MKNFTWVSVYNEIANKIMKFENDYKGLVDLMYKSLEESGLMYSEEKGCNLDFDGKERIRYDEIDPISFMNRFELYSNDNRKKLIENVEKNLGMDIKIPSDFDGLPMTNPQRSIIIGFKNGRNKNDVPDIWNLVKIALSMNINNEKERNDFVEAYNKVIAKPGAKFNISIGLFKMRPDVFLNLDSTNREYLKERFNISINSSRAPDGKKYLELIGKVKEKMEEKSFAEFSYNAWLNKEKKNDIKDEIQYFWLNANPKIWSFSELKIGEIIEYTATNLNGNKRRIYKNYQDAKKGDKIIAYESTPTKAIVGICEVEEALKDNVIKVKKLETLINPIPYENIINDSELENMEFLRNPNGSLFALTFNEFNNIMDKIREENSIVIKNKFESYTKEDFLKEVYISNDEYNKLYKLLNRKKNVILQGAPGVGKTYMAKRLAYSIMGEKNPDRVKIVQFHQNYSYEDFIEGYKANSTGYELRKGNFYKFCIKAENDIENPYFFIIDEINRGNLSKIFGELMMLIENDKRGERLTLAYSEDKFNVPENVYIIGMMNTADRSLALLDYALRRRFAFYKVKPAFESDQFKKYKKKLSNEKFNKLISVVEELNQAIHNDVSLGEGFEIGHSYFCNYEDITDEDIDLIINYEILPLLEEYWFDDEDTYNNWKEKLNGVLNG